MLRKRVMSCPEMPASFAGYGFVERNVARSRDEQHQEGGQVHQGHFLLSERIAPMDDESCNGHGNDQRNGCKPRGEAKHDEDSAKKFGKNNQSK